MATVEIPIEMTATMAISFGFKVIDPPAEQPAQAAPPFDSECGATESGSFGPPAAEPPTPKPIAITFTHDQMKAVVASAFHSAACLPDQGARVLVVVTSFLQNDPSIRIFLGYFEGRSFIEPGSLGSKTLWHRNDILGWCRHEDTALALLRFANGIGALNQ